MNMILYVRAPKVQPSANVSNSRTEQPKKNDSTVLLHMLVCIYVHKNIQKMIKNAWWFTSKWRFKCLKVLEARNRSLTARPLVAKLSSKPCRAAAFARRIREGTCFPAGSQWTLGRAHMEQDLKGVKLDIN